MGLGDLTRQFAQEAIKSSTKDMLDSLRPPELAGIADAIAGTEDQLQSDQRSVFLY